MQSSKITDQNLVTQYIQGNEACLEMLINRHKDRIFTTIILIVKDSYIAEDLFQETFIKIIKNPIPLPKNIKSNYKKTKLKIAVALDNSFNFYYDDNLNALRREGASLTFFSPIKDKKLIEVTSSVFGDVKATFY